MDPAHVIISDNSGNPPMKVVGPGRDRLHGKLVVYRALIIYRFKYAIFGRFVSFSRGKRGLNHGSR